MCPSLQEVHIRRLAHHARRLVCCLFWLVVISVHRLFSPQHMETVLEMLKLKKVSRHTGGTTFACMRFSAGPPTHIYPDLCEKGDFSVSVAGKMHTVSILPRVQFPTAINPSASRANRLPHTHIFSLLCSLYLRRLPGVGCCSVTGLFAAQSPPFLQARCNASKRTGPFRQVFADRDSTENRPTVHARRLNTANKLTISSNLNAARRTA